VHPFKRPLEDLEKLQELVRSLPSGPFETAYEKGIRRAVHFQCQTFV